MRFWNYGYNVRSAERKDWLSYPAGKIKSMREDFCDMFIAEQNMREKRNHRSFVFCLTYNDEHLKSFYGQNVADSDDLHRYAKSSRLLKDWKRRGFSFDMVTVPEYGNGGESHDYKGKRGKGQNPHFHGVGWFSKLDDSPINDMEYSMLCDEFRLEWQGCLEGNIITYAKDMHLRSLGLGYVKFCSLDAYSTPEVRSAEKGARYIGKYIGKDIGSKFIRNLKDSYEIAIYNIFKDLLREYISNMPDAMIRSIIWHWLSSIVYPRSYSLIKLEFSKTNILQFRDWFFNKYKYFSFPPIWFCHCQDAIVRQLDEHFIIFDEEFSSQWCNRYAPKLRKFHGFGYSLLDNCDKLKGTYNITKSCGSIPRFLPPSLYRHLYYEYSRCVPDEKRFGSKSEYIVSYTLNDLGKQHVRYSLEKIFFQDQMLVKAYADRISDDLKKNIRTVSAVYRCIRPFDLHPDLFSSLDLSSLLADPISYCIKCKSKVVCDGLVVYADDRPFVTGNYIASLLVDPMLLQEFEDLIKLHRRRKEKDDEEYNEAWLRCYSNDY